MNGNCSLNHAMLFNVTDYGGREGQIPYLLKIVALPKIADLPKFASQDRSLVCTFLIEPRFQRNGGKDRKATIRSQETEERVGLSYSQIS